MIYTMQPLESCSPETNSDERSAYPYSHGRIYSDEAYEHLKLIVLCQTWSNSQRCAILPLQGRMFCKEQFLGCFGGRDAVAFFHLSISSWDWHGCRVSFHLFPSVNHTPTSKHPGCISESRLHCACAVWCHGVKGETGQYFDGAKWRSMKICFGCAAVLCFTQFSIWTGTAERWPLLRMPVFARSASRMMSRGAQWRLRYW